MDILINAIAPIFLIVVTGFLLGKFRLVKHEVAGAIMQYVFFAAAPAIVFYAIISNPIDKLLYWKFWLAYPISLLFVVAITALFFKLVLKRDWFIASIAGFAAAFANTVIIGYPVLSGMIGHDAAFPMSITVIIFMLVMLPLMVFLLEFKKSNTENKLTTLQVIRRALLSTLKNPLVLAVMLGILCSVFSLPVPKFIKSFSGTIGESLTPCALFAVGLDLSKFQVKGKLVDVAWITAINLLLMPAIGILLALSLKLSPTYAVALVIFSAVPTAKTLYAIVSQYDVYVSEVAAVLSTTTVFSVFTIPMFTFIAHLIWPSAFIH